MSQDTDREALVESARTTYGIVNAEDMSNDQLKREIRAIDEQDPNHSKSEDSGVKKQVKKTAEKLNQKAKKL